MPARQPFTQLCRAAARRPTVNRADLHVHTTASDGTYTPAQVVDLARRSGLAAVAITDHDTLGGVAAAQAAAAGFNLEVIPGVEISAEYQGKEFHLLGYFFRLDDGPLLAALERLRAERTERFWDMVERLKQCGVSIEEDELPAPANGEALGRRHLAEILVRTRRAGSVREAFLRYLGDGGRVVTPKTRLPVADAIALVRGAGGVASWAHPSYDCERASLCELHGLGLQAVEAVYPGFRPSRTRELRSWAAALKMAVTGGSDCHGPDQPRRAVGVCGITSEELEVLRQSRDRV
jgi:predicted metal-dependent phosphoesterase TrpH